MKIGIGFTYNFENPSKNSEMLFKLREVGFDAIDFDMVSTETDFYKLNKEELNKLLDIIKSEIKAAGLFVSQVHGPWIWPPKRDASVEGRLERMEKMKKSIEICSLLGSKYWVVHPVMPFGCDNVPPETKEETYKINKEFFTELTKFAESKKVVIAYENMPFSTFPISAPDKILSLIKLIDSDYFKMCFDTGHANLVMNGSLYDNIKKIGKELKVLHVHDNNGKGDYHKFPYDGIIDWQEFMKALKEINYEGVFSLETLFKNTFGTKEYDEELKYLYATAKKLTE
ncbi:MAG: sugar phosphate isomerase/epimerase [Clostridia bacterium]|nr:sugar phosphate isomerase/epimerase [Clostridia bacterium]